MRPPKPAETLASEGECRVALILSGAVSLGSFEAGVLTELLHCLDRQSRRRDAKRFVLDVIAGASAGSMTAALVARAVMHGVSYTRLLHEAWVKRIDLRDLLHEPQGNAILSRSPIDRIAEDMLAPAPGDGAGAPCPFAPETFRLTFTLTNLNGVDYELPTSPGSEHFVSTFHADKRTFELTRANCADAKVWEKIREAAVASGNFPLAFPPLAVRATPEDYQQHNLRTALPETFACIDGGFFNNEPIREAVLLARKADLGFTGERIFLLVDAHLNRSSAAPDFHSDASLAHTVRRLFGALWTERAANDWLRAARINEQIEWRDQLLRALTTHLAEAERVDWASLNRSMATAAGEIIEHKRRVQGSAKYPDDYLERALERTEPLLRLPEGIAGNGDLRREALRHLGFVLNSVAALDKKEKLAIHIIATDPDASAGDRLAAFGGFFDEEWREHDFQLGVKKARTLLPRMLECEEEPVCDCCLPAKDYSQVTLADADPRLRRALRDGIVRKARATLRSVIPATLIVRAVLAHLAGYFVRWVFGRHLMLPHSVRNALAGVALVVALGAFLYATPETSRPWWGDPTLPVVLGVLALLALALFVVVKIPSWQAERVAAAAADRRVELENTLRQTAIQVVGGAVVILGLIATWIQIREAARTRQDELYSELFMESVAILDEKEDTSETRKVAAVASLERIANSSRADHRHVTGIFADYLRGQARVGEVEYPEEKVIPPHIQSIAGALARTSRRWKAPGRNLNLRKVHLTNAQMPDAWFEGADFDGAVLWNTQLHGASFRDAVLSGADLTESKLIEADLRGASLKNVVFRGADLRKADLRDVVEGDQVKDWTGANILGMKCSNTLRVAALADSAVELSGTAWGQAKKALRDTVQEQRSRRGQAGTPADSAAAAPGAPRLRDTPAPQPARRGT